MTILRRFREYIDYLFTRELLGAVTMIFSLENVVETVVVATLPASLHVWVWLGLFVAFTVLFMYWGEADDPSDADVSSLGEVFEDDEG